jgi:PST family polysaccharide transporter
MMQDSRTSYTNIYRVLGVLGSAGAATTFLSLLRNKAFAVFLGPGGYGTVVLLNALVSTSGNLGGVGVGYSATRIISRARGRYEFAFAEFVERSLCVLGYKLAGTTVLATLLVLTVWAYDVGGDTLGGISIIATAIAAGVSILVSVNTTRMQIRRLPRRLAASMLGGALLFTLVSIPAAAILNLDAIPVVVVALPLSLWISTSIAVERNRPNPHKSSSRSRGEVAQREIVRKGVPLMLPGLVESAGTFVVRAVGVAELGLATIGHVYAASALASFILTTVMSAMNQDFLPRLCEAVDSRARMRSLAVEQLFVTIQLSAPILLFVCTFSSEVTSLLFSAQFSETARLVPLMAILVIANIANWPVHTMQTALGFSRQQLAGTAANSIVVLGTIAIMHDSLDATTFVIALLAGALGQLVTQATLLWRRTKLRLFAREWSPIALLLASIVAVVMLTGSRTLTGSVVGLALTLTWAAAALRHYVAHRANP